MPQSEALQLEHECDVRTEIYLNGVGNGNDSNHRAEPRDIWKARQFIEEHAGEHLSLRKVASEIGINPTHLSEKFKQVTGVKYVDYVANVRFQRAKKLLEDVDLRVSEIAFAVGFQSLSQFNRVFKKFSLKSPTEHRVTHLKKKNRR